jgi:hypothetical protein
MPDSKGEFQEFLSSVTAEAGLAASFAEAILVGAKFNLEDLDPQVTWFGGAIVDLKDFEGFDWSETLTKHLPKVFQQGETPRMEEPESISNIRGFLKRCFKRSSSTRKR